MASNGFYARRRGIYEHLQDGTLDFIDLGIHDWLCGHARSVMDSNRFPAGVWIGSAAVIWRESGKTEEFNQQRIYRRLKKLEKLGYLKAFRVNDTTLAYVLNKFTVYSKNVTYTVNAEATTDWRKPVYERDERLMSARQSGEERSMNARQTSDELKDTYDTEDTEKTVETDDTLVRSQVAATLPEVSLEGQTGGKTPAVSNEGKAISAVNIPSVNPLDNLSDMREWPENESRFGISGLRLRNCLRFCIESLDYYKEHPPTLASMNREKFVKMIDEQTPPGWPPGWSRKNPRPKNAEGLLKYKLDKPQLD